MNPTVYVKVKERIEARRLAALNEATARNEELRIESEEIAKIDEELQGTGLLIFKTACQGGDLAPIKRRNLELQKKRCEILKKLGYPEDYTKVHYSCPDCSDTGFTKNNGKVCHCFRSELIKERIAASGMGELMEKQSFQNFDLECYNYDDKVYASMRRILNSAKNYVKNFSKNPINLVLIGKTGTGKTHISTAIAKEIIEQGYDVLYDSAQNIINDFESDKFKSGYGNYGPKSEKYLECDLLIIDDLGTEFSNQFTVACIYNLLNTRQNRGLATIVSTNLSMEEIQNKYDDRIFSRLVGSGKVLPFEGKDRRINH